MLVEIGAVEAIFRYPVKSMAGEQLQSAQMGWHGLEGDRRMALRRVNERGGMPWLTASRLPELLRYMPLRCGEDAKGELPTHVRTPAGDELPVFSADLAAEVERRHGAPVQMMQLNNGIFDDANISVIAAETVNEIGRLAGRTMDIRRFRPNVVLRLARPAAFEEDTWLGGILLFGGADDAPAVTVSTRDLRCAMVNLDPETAASAPEVMKAIVRANQNNAGIYGAVTRVGRIEVGQAVFLQPAGEKAKSMAQT